MDNKYIWLIGGLLIGYFVCKKRTGKQMQAAIDKTSTDVTNEISKTFDDMLAQASEKGLSVDQVRNFLKTA